MSMTSAPRARRHVEGHRNRSVDTGSYYSIGRPEITVNIEGRNKDINREVEGIEDIKGVEINVFLRVQETVDSPGYVRIGDKDRFVIARSIPVFDDRPVRRSDREKQGD
jgi:hypothetical protein